MVSVRDIKDLTDLPVRVSPRSSTKYIASWLPHGLAPSPLVRAVRVVERHRHAAQTLVSKVVGQRQVGTEHLLSVLELCVDLFERMAHVS